MLVKVNKHSWKLKLPNVYECKLIEASTFYRIICNACQIEINWWEEQLPDIDGSSTDRPSRCMVFCCGMKGVEHIPVRQHDLSKESAVVCHSSNMDGMRFWIPWEEIIRSPHHSRLLRTARQFIDTTESNTWTKDLKQELEIKNLRQTKHEA